MFSFPMPEHTVPQGRRAPASAVAKTDTGWSEADMDNFPAGQARDAKFEPRAMLSIADPFETLHADDNLGDEAPFPSTWQQLDCADVPHE
jgi:hypothetical protein